MVDMRPAPWHSHDFLAIVGTEIAYFVIVVVLCMIIYFKTREIYDLTKYKGLFYFRNTFLFFAIAYFFRMLQSLYMVSARTTDFFLPFLPPWYFNPIVLFLIAYLSSMAILSLTYSTMWKRVEKQAINQDYILNFIAIGIALITFVTRNFMFLVAIQLLLVLFAVAMAYIGYETRKALLSKLHVTYTLLFVFWVTSLLVLATPFLFLELRFLLYGVSIIVLLSIAYRVVRRLSNV